VPSGPSPFEVLEVKYKLLTLVNEYPPFDPYDEKTIIVEAAELLLSPLKLLPSV
jgi:hypothetical protein